MSSFLCEICGASILDSTGGYTTGCQHYPTDIMLEEQSRLARIGGRPCEWTPEQWAQWSAKEHD